MACMPSMKAFILTACYLAAPAAASEIASATATGKIDVHAHYLPDFYAAALTEAGFTPGPEGLPAIPAWSPATHLQFMANQSIDKSYLSISSPGVYLTVPSKNATKNAIKLARQVNEYGAALKKQYPDKFGYFASLPLPDVNASLREVEYIFTKLDPCPDGVVLMSNFYGMYLGDPSLDQVYAALNARNITIFEHPTTPCTEHDYLTYNIDDNASPVPQKEWQALNRPVATRQFATATLDFPFDTARTFADLFYSKVPSRFPNIKWIIPHAGGGLIPTLDRIVTYSFLYPGLNLTEASMKKTLASNFFFDLAGPWPVTYAIPPLLRWVNYTNIMWGSDVPFTPWASASGLSAHFDSDIQTVFNNDTIKVQAVRRKNAIQLLD